MAQSNHERVGRVLEILNTGLKPFVERERSATARLEEVVRRIEEQHFPLLATRKDDKLNHSLVQVPTKRG